MRRKVSAVPTRNHALRIRIHPSEAQAQQFARTFGCVRKYWNLALEDVLAHGTVTPPARYKDLHPYLRDIDSSALCNVQLNLDKALRDHRENPKHFDFPTFKSKFHCKKSYSTNANPRTQNVALVYSGSYWALRLPKVPGLVRVTLHRKPKDNFRLKKVTVRQTPDGNYFATLLFEETWQGYAFAGDLTNAIGLDYASGHFAVASTGDVLEPPHAYRKAEKRLAREERKLSRMRGPKDASGRPQAPSANYRKQKRKVARMERRVANIRRDFAEKVSSELTDRFDLIALEDIDLSAQAKRKRGPKFGKSVADNGFGFFRMRLAQKAEAKGKLVVKVGKYFPSTQLCSACGHKNASLRGLTSLGVRNWTCPVCGTEHDRDVNAAQNLVTEATRIVNEYVRITGGLPGIASLCLEDLDPSSKRKRNQTTIWEAPTSNSVLACC